MSKIQNVSKFFKWVFQITFILLPVLLILFWINAPAPVSAMMANNGFIITFIPDSIKILHPLSLNTKILGFLISLIPLAVNLSVLYFLIQLFKHFEKLDFFSRDNVQSIKYIGYALFIGQLLSPIYQALISAAVTWNNPPGHGIIGITLDQTNIGMLLVSLLIILISWIMGEAYKMKQEQQYTV